MEDIKKENSESTNETKKEASEKQKFIIRLISWIMLACVLPVLFIAWRYDLFKPQQNWQLGGWGVIAIAIIMAFVLTLLKYFKQLTKNKWSMTSQIIGGVIKVILPLLTVLLIMNSIKDNVDLAMQSLGVIIVCEFVAIPVNPMPKYIYEQTKGEQQGMIDYFFSKYDERKGKK